MRTKRLLKKTTKLQAADWIYLAAVLFVIVVTILLFLERELFSGALPLVFACGIYMTVFWQKRMSKRPINETCHLLLQVMYCVILIGLGLVFLVSCLTNWM